MYSSSTLPDQTPGEALQQRYISVLEELLRTRDAEIARLREAVRTGSMPDASAAIRADPSLPVGATTTPTNSTALTTPTAAASTAPIIHVPPAWDANDPIESYRTVMRSRYAGVAQMKPSQTLVVKTAVERYLRMKIGRTLQTPTGQPGIPVSLRLDFLEWMDTEMDNGLLDPNQSPAQSTESRLNRRKEMGQPGSVAESLQQYLSEATTSAASAASASSLKRKSAPLETSTHPTFKGWLGWTELVRNKYPNWTIPDGRTSVFVKLFCESRGIPMKRRKGGRGGHSRALPDVFHAHFICAFEEAGFHTRRQEEVASQLSPTAATQKLSAMHTESISSGDPSDHDGEEWRLPLETARPELLSESGRPSPSVVNSGRLSLQSFIATKALDFMRPLQNGMYVPISLSNGNSDGTTAVQDSSLERQAIGDGCTL